MPDPFTLSTYAEEQEWLADEIRPLPKRNPPAKGWPALLSVVSKMRCMSFGIPAYQCCPGSQASTNLKLGLCRMCYAAKGRYGFPAVKSAMQYRLEVTRDVGSFVAVMIDAIADPSHYAKVSGKYAVNVLDPNYFRVHHSGDFYSPEYIGAWAEICDYYKNIAFWFPTRTWAMPARWESRAEPGRVITKVAMIRALGELSQLDNVTVRPSFLIFDKMPVRENIDLPGGVRWSAPTGAFLWKNVKVAGEVWEKDPAILDKWKDQVFICPASKEKSDRANCATVRGFDGNVPCRECWNGRNLSVAYKQH